MNIDIDININDKIILCDILFFYILNKKDIEFIIESDFENNTIKYRGQMPSSIYKTTKFILIEVFKKDIYLFKRENLNLYILIHGEVLNSMFKKNKIEIDMKTRRLNNLEHFGI